MKKTRLLCVEDDSINAFIMEKLLAKDYDLVCVKDFESCLNELENGDYDVILMDINLGRGQMDGTDLLKTIRENERISNIPVFAITSYALPGDREKFLEMGFNHYFSKPIDRNELIGIIQKYVS